MINKFDPKINWIGNREWMYKFTDKISKNYPEINFTAFKHDGHYYWIYAESNMFIRYIMKLMYDLIFLILGSFRCLIKYRIDGIPIVILLYLLLFFSSPWLLYVTKNKQIDLTRL